MKKVFITSIALFFVFFAAKSFAQDAKQDFTLVNKTGVVIDQLHITPSDVDEWGEDILGKDVLLSDEECDVTFHPKEKVCLWDMRIADKDDNSITWEDIDLCKYTIITLHWDGKTATATFE